MSLGKQISFYRKKKGMSQAELAEALDVSFQAVSSWERGEYSPDVGRLVPLAETLGTTAGRLLEENDVPDWPLRRSLFDDEHMFTFIRSAAVARKWKQTSAALPYARALHEGQTRKGASGNVPYITHPLTMACHALAMGLNEDDVVAAMLLHDVVEDCGVTAEELPVGDRVKRAVGLVTFKGGKRTDKKAETAYFRGIGGDSLASLVKCADRVNNLTDMAGGFTRNRMAAYVTETETYIVPLLGVVKDASPKWNSAAWMLTYQMTGLLEIYKRML
jgi:(p)ppGpp synthase/HD superfamily hydrolase/DNA-binding XRE family transcriptional regulator